MRRMGRWILLVLLTVAVAGKGKKPRHQKPGRALLDRLSSTTVGEVPLTSDSGLQPAPLDVAPYATVATNATCGDADSEEYCRDTPGKRGVVCDVCDGMGGAPSRRHPPGHAVDGDSGTWWQSPTIAQGEEYRHVDLVATLPSKMELLHVIIKCGPSPRPLAWSLEVSSSEAGEDWRLIRAYGDKDHCRRLWDLRPERRRRKARAVKRTNRADKLTCSTQFASPRPLENGEMHVAIGEGVNARRVRISLRAPQPLPSSQQYYTVRALTLAARCVCHGHADHCSVDNKGAKCDCLHGTCGIHCQRCCSGAPWAAHQPCEKVDVRLDADETALNPDNNEVPDESGERLECSCGGRGECSYDDGAILCVNCTENRAGPLCDRCLPGYYSNIPDGPCLPCNCYPEGSDGTCKWNKKRHHVLCNCRPLYTGSFCDACEDPRAVFPSCEMVETTPACKCDPRGIVDPDRVCDDICECKENVVGERCDACAPGYFGLSLPGGCQQCYCSHFSSSCVLSGDNTMPLRTILPLDQSWRVTDLMTQKSKEPVLDPEGKLYLITFEVEGWDSYYWFSPALSGDRLSLYGGELVASMVWGVARGDTGGNPTVGSDFILVGADGTRLLSRNISYERSGQQILATSVTEDAWSNDDGPVTRTQLMDVLRDVKGVMIRAHFHQDQDEIRLESAELVEGPASQREQCACPGGTRGAHCQLCARTHVRSGSQCLPCDCNGHATCDSVNGPCGECQHNTTGQHCERCLPGHYGNPVQGACKPCACPLYLASNNFSPNCALAAAEGDDYVCTQCPDGYAGDHCENCDTGYYGSPTTPGGSCKPCECGGGTCHPDTGACLACPPHAEGPTCELCEEGYWLGGAADGNSSCVRCACAGGALSAACGARSGQCACKPGWAGRTCDRCDTGYTAVSSTCHPCRCGTAALSRSCDAVSGACACAEGAAPPACEYCLDEYYDISRSGCKGCNCSTVGSESNVCDIRTGQCRCRPHVTGRACDICEEGYWGLQLGGCRRCACGAGTAACDPVNGACACGPGVGGDSCDKCLPGFYGFGANGCLPCPTCTDGKVCSVESGRCVCPAHAHGPGCRLCAAGYTRAQRGCKPCECGPGAVTETCDSQSGQCKCRAGWTGPACDACAAGHWGPRCRPCGCHLPGTLCEKEPCSCDEGGRCPCKENVVGDKCDACLDGTFGLSGLNPAGCTACFCFGRSSHCTQASLSRAALHVAAHAHLTVAYSDERIHVDHDSMITIRTSTLDATISIPLPPVPVYMELDSLFHGDRVTSYGGALRFRVEEEGGRDLDKEVLLNWPLVRIEGPVTIDYYERIPAINSTYAARLHESLWKVPGKSGAASRSVLMLALQNVTRILVRVTTRAPTRIERLHTLLLNVSLDTAIPGLSRSEPALGVERCSCPRGYGAGSCQQPAVGFWMPPQRIRYTSVGGTILIQLEGEVQPCHCNGRAKSCDPVTGDCLNCTHGTGGPQCADCAAGHYGSPASPDGCQPCPCPSRTHNFATACAVTAGRVHCLCAQGYSGLECELCASGYYRASDGVTCASCACDIRGATDERCDHARCRCRPFVTGDRCDRCREPRTFLTDEGCLPCDNCTQTLLDSVEALSADLRIRADINELSRIPKPFPALLEFAHNTTMLQDSLHILLNNKERHKNIERLISNLEEDEHRIFTEANKLSTEAKKYESHAQYLSLESMSGLEEVYKQRASIGELVANLDDFAKGERHVSAHRALKEANHLLKQIKEINLVDFIAGTHDVADSANLQSTSVQEYDYRLSDTYQRLKKLQSTLEAWEMKSDDLVRLADIVWTAGDHVAELEKTVRPRLAGIRDIGLRCRLMLEDITSLSPKNLTSDITTAILQSQALAIKFPEYHAELDALTLAAEEKEGILYTITPTYKQKYLDVVQKHVEELADKAKKYKSLFAGTRLLASKGVAAAHAWSEVAKTVREAETIANEAHNAASDAVAIARGPDPLVETAAEGRVASEELKTRAAKLLKKAEELRSHLEHLRRGADLVSVELRALGWLERALSAPQTQPAPALAHAGTQADRVFAMSRALYDEASGIRRAVTYELRRRLTELRRHGDSALGAAQEHVSQIRGNTVQAAEAAEALNSAAEARAREHTAAAAKLNPSLQALRDKIARARHAANSISVSLTSVPGWAAGCSRAYRVRPASSAVSLVTVAVTFDNHVADGPLLYLVDRSQEQAKYLKLVVNNKRLRLTWDLGGGEGSILHHEVLQPTHDEGDHNTYRIEIERIWNSVHLRLERAGNSLVSVSNSTSPDHVTFRPSRLWLGHRERGEGPGLPGCVHSLQTGGETLGLWHSEAQPPTAKCTGCSMRWYATPGAGDTSLAWFNGAGYAELRRSGRRAADRRQFSVAFTFRTRDQHALLFMTTDTVNNRSITVTLRDCRVVFTVEYAAGRLEIVSGGRHCSGRPVHVQAIRVYQPHRLERGSLRVNGEETLGSPSPAVDSAAALPDLTSAAYCVGGAPPGAAAPAPPLLGALGALTVDRKGYDLRDTPSRFGMELGVVEKPLYSASFEGSGFVELPSPQWRRKAALGLSFRARAPDGLILFRSPGTNNEVDDENDGFYLVIVLVKGSLAVLASAGKGEVRLVSNSTRFDDGALHTIRLVRNHKQLELWSDAERLSTTSLSGGAFPARDRGLYLGGVAHGLAQARPVFPAIGFTGTIADFIVDSELTQLESSVSWSDAGLGRADSDDPAETVLEPSTLQAQPENDFGCVKRSSFTVEAGAVKFGDAAHSHTSLRLAGKGRQLALSLQLRTFASDGLLFLVPGSKLKPKHYLALMVREGKLKLIARGRKRKEVSLAGNVSDGTWRSVTVRISRSRLILSSEGVAATAHMAAISRAQRIYIGGLPQAMPVQVPANVLKAGVFRGCVRRMRVHGRDEDLVRDARSHHAVGQCFPRVEPAAYFGGDAHALWSRGWAHAPGTPLELRLQFRSPEPHGLLLAAADITLELADGAVVLSRHSADLEPSRAEARGASRSFCDNAWHLVIARVGRASLALSVDAGPEIRTERMLVDLGDAAAAEVVTPVYVAGLPEDMINSPDGKENFKGCLRDVIIGGQKKDWASMDTLHNVLLDSCPVSE